MASYPPPQPRSSVDPARQGAYVNRAMMRPIDERGGYDMASKYRTVRVTPDVNLPTLHDDAAKEPLLLERDGELFRLSRADDDIAYEPDPDLVRRTLAATAGSWADLDVDQVVSELDATRRAGSRPLGRP